MNRELLKAVEIGDHTEVENLINRGATLHKLTGLELHQYNSEYDTPLHIAAKLGHFSLVQLFVELNCDVNAQTRRKKATPLHYATYPHVDSKIIEYLLTHGAAVEAKDDDNATAFLWACFLNNPDAINLLIRSGTDVHSKDDFNYSGLDWAAHKGNLEAVKALLEKVNYSDEQLKHALQLAAENGQQDVYDFLQAR